MPRRGAEQPGFWTAWHAAYDDPGSAHSQRLAVVQDCIRSWADGARAGPLRLISMCAGQAHDVAALESHPRRRDVSGLLVEQDAHNVALAEKRLAAAGLTGLRAVVGDAARLESYLDEAPADLLLACGIFGNICDEDVRRTIEAMPSLVASGGTVVWTRHRREPDLTDQVRRWFDGQGFDEVGFHSPGLNQFAVGVHRFTAAPAAMPATNGPLFTFVR